MTQEPEAMWKGDVKNNIRKMHIFNWKQVAKNKDGRRRAITDAFILLG